MSQIVPQQKVKDGTLSDLISSNAGSVQSLQQILTNADVQSLLLVNTSVSVIKNCRIVVQSSSISKHKPTYQVFNETEALIIVCIPPKNLNLEDTDETLKLKGF